MASSILMPVRAGAPGSWYAPDARLLAAMPTAAAQLCPITVAAAHEQAQVGGEAAVTRATAKRTSSTNAPQGAGDGFVLPGRPGFPHPWWTSV